MKKKYISLLLAALTFSSTLGFGSTNSLAASYSTTSGNYESVSPFNNATYKHADIFSGKKLYNGIDVSYHKGTIDWKKVKEAGVDYALIRLGYRGYGSTGTLCQDTKYFENIKGAINAGIPVGVYYYTEAITTKEAAEEAAYTLERIKDYKITLPVVIDFEPGTNKGRSYKANLSKSAATNIVKTFCEKIAEAGYKPMIYANKSDLTTRIDGATLSKSYKIWLARYNSSAGLDFPYEFWQYASNGTVNGISSKGSVDCNFWYTSTNLTATPNAINISGAKAAAIASATYTGSNIKPVPVLTYNGKTLVKNKDYTITYTNNISIGTATICVNGIGDYKGTKSISFKINPTKITSFKKKSQTKAITLSWSKNSTVTGYRIYRKDTYNATAYTRVKTITTPSTLTWKNANLEADREYFYKIRAYKKINDTYYYGEYTSLTAATLPGSKKATVTQKAVLYKSPNATGTKLAEIPKNAVISYHGRTFVTSSKKSLHVTYVDKDNKSYKGYLLSTTKLKF